MPLLTPSQSSQNRSSTSFAIAERQVGTTERNRGKLTKRKWRSATNFVEYLRDGRIDVRVVVAIVVVAIVVVVQL